MKYDKTFRSLRAGFASIDWHEVDGEELGWAIGVPSYVPYD